MAFQLLKKIAGINLFYLNKSICCTIVTILIVNVFVEINTASPADIPQLKVGVYDFNPLVFLDSEGKAQGFLIDIMDDIVRNQGWSVVYVPGDFEECLDRLKTGEIDLLLPVAYSKERENICEFTKEDLFIIWAEIYKPEKSSINTIADLKDKKIAVVEGAQANKELMKLLDEFGVTFTLIEYHNYSEVLNSIEKSECDSGILSNLFGFQIMEKNKVERTQILFAPTKLKVAMNRGMNRTKTITEILDRNIAKYKANNHSIYYDSYNKWIRPPGVAKVIVPKWVYLLLSLLTFLTIVVIGFNWVLRRTIKIKTDDLILSNQHVQSKAEALSKSENHLKLALESAKAGTWEWDLNTNENTWSEKLFLLYDLDPKTYKASYDTWMQSIIPRDRDLTGAAVQDAVSKKSEIYIEWQVNIKDGSIRWLMSRGRPQRDSNGRITRYLGVVIDITERKTSEEALKQEYGLLQTVMDGAKNAHLVYLDRDFNFVRVNETYANTCGYKSNEMVGKNHFVLFPHPENEAIFAGVRDTGEPFQIKDKPFEFPGQPERGITYWDWMFNPVKDSLGQVTGLIFSLFETTERKRSEEIMIESQERTSSILTGIADTFFSVDAQWRFTLVNPAAEKAPFGRPSADLIGKVIWDLYPELVGTKIYQNYLDVAKNGILKHYEGQSPLNSLWYEVFMQGWKGGVDVYMRDITNRKEAEESLQVSEKRYRTLFENMAQGVFYQRSDGVLFNYNNTALEMFGLTPDQFVGKTSLDPQWKVITEDGTDLPGDKHPSMVALQTGKPVQDAVIGVYNPERKNYKWLVVNAIPQFNQEEEKPFQVFVTLQDITERKQSEEEREKLQIQLAQMQKMEAIGSLAGGIAHDLNNILFPISGFSEMLLDEIPPDNHAHESIEQIYKSAKRGSDLVNQILAFSRQSNLQKLPIRIQPILKEVLKLVRATIPKNIELTSHIEKDCGRVSADPTQIHQIAMNLITNAYHAVEENDGSINIELKEMEFGRYELHDYVIKPGKYVVLSVSDTGTGIDRSLIDKIFDPYFTTKVQGKGTGLGLSVVLGIVKEHGGDVRVDSQVGKGTTFNVYLPLDENSNDNKAAAVTRKHPTGTENILLVDDEEPIAKMLQMMLEKLGYKVTARTSSPDALNAFNANPSKFDLVISDRGMPNMTGEQLARELISIKPEIPILLCTGFAEESDENRAMAMGVKGFLKKPVATGDLAEMVRKVLDESKTSTSGLF